MRHTMARTITLPAVRLVTCRKNTARIGAGGHVERRRLTAHCALSNACQGHQLTTAEFPQQSEAPGRPLTAPRCIDTSVPRHHLPKTVRDRCRWGLCTVQTSPEPTTLLITLRCAQTEQPGLPRSRRAQQRL